MQAANFPPARLERFANCGAFARVMVRQDTGDHRLQASYCHDRFCQPCSTARSMQVADNLASRIKSKQGTYKHVVLTMKHRDEDLALQVARLYDHFKKLRSRHLWKSSMQGGIYFLQVHVSERDGLWHPHLHIIAEGAYVPQEELSAEWLHVTGDSANVHVSQVRDGDQAAKEVARYVGKPLSAIVLLDQDKTTELMRALTGRHLCAAFGTWRSWKVTAKPKRDTSIPWVDAGPLTDWIRRAAGGEEHAKIVLAHLCSREIPCIGPPALFSPNQLPN